MHFIISGVQALGGCHRLRIICEPALKPWLWSRLRLDVVGGWERIASRLVGVRVGRLQSLITWESPQTAM